MAAAEHETTLRRTPLFEAHVEAGAKLVDFAGWEMPVQYAGVLAEHRAVREGVGIFDVSHMGQVRTTGPQALDLLQRLTSNDVTKIAPGGAQYGLLCNEEGGVLDDLFTYRLGVDEYLTVTNAANHETDLAWMREHADGLDATLEDAASEYAMIAVQGPNARELVQTISDSPLPRKFTAQPVFVAGHQMLVCGTGYTGEDGVELLCRPEDAPAVWAELTRRGAAPVGLAARDTLRLEACFHLHGNDLTPETDPISAGLGWAAKEDTGFIGSDAIRAVRAAGPAQRLVPFKLEGGGIARPHNPVVGGGEVTSGTMSPTLGVGIGLAYLPTERTQPGTAFQIDVRGRTRDAVVAAKPLIPAPN